MDNHHVTISGSQISCGVAQLYNITSDPEKVLYAIATALYHPSRGTPYAFLTWSDAPDSNGEKFASSLEKVFGAVDLTETDWEENPKTGNHIKVFVWTIPHEDFKKWYIEQRVERAKKL